MAFYLYSQDYSGTIFMYNSGNALNWDDTTSSDGTMTNAYLKYLGGGAPTTRIRKMRTCPAIAGRLTEDQIVNGQHHNYGMIWPSVRLPGIGWTTLPPTAGTWYVIPVRVLSKPAEYLLLIDSNTENVPLSSFLRATTGNDHETGLPVMSRHSNAVNCLFGDQHVELVSSNRIIQQSGIPITRNTWFQLN
jgi:prepilin-type processing-associated H-X9-DG protein